MDQENQKNIIIRENAVRQARYKAGNLDGDFEFSLSTTRENKSHHAQERFRGTKKDFFGRIVRETMPLQEIEGNAEVVGMMNKAKRKREDDNKVWVSFHEGFSNAVRKPITIEELLKGL